MATTVQRFEGDDATVALGVLALNARGSDTSEIIVEVITEIMRLLIGDPQTLNVVVITKTAMHYFAADEINEIRQLVNSGKVGVCLMTIISDVYIEKKGGEK